eukprot:CAMPEP_0117508338 /NCGR_PEP_ID=MMETSP0784-20121206/26897_1 /TAXON_ID=39447 /ORGANISM="" /LENGTH=476 /DNA_ID=CAMNT_0005303889 /DNA_START=27 /DNA_END=1457 /DNA_ORIENTATION=-
MDGGGPNKDTVLAAFRRRDVNGRGHIGRANLARALERLGCTGVDPMLEAAGFPGEGEVNYKDFVDWLMDSGAPSSPTRPATHSASAPNPAPHLDEKENRQLCPTRPAEPAAQWSADLVVPLDRPRTRSKSRCNIHNFRDEAAAVVTKTGRAGEFVDDLREIAIVDVNKKSAIAYWRCCHGLRLYRSETVSNALRLICSAPVPGLGGVSYLGVFGALTESVWEQHIYLFGGLVRDILRRVVGNDIDIAFSAPAAELEEVCRRHGYMCRAEGDYIVIGDASGEEYLEGMVITHNGIQPAHHSDFSMNWLFYDFCNDVIVDKTGAAIPAVAANRCEIPCPRDAWNSWVDVNGCRVLFRYYKFLVRGYAYDDGEMSYIAGRLLEFWNCDPNRTIAVGKDAMGGLVGSQDAEKIECLRQLVFKSFEIVAASHHPKSRSRTRSASLELAGGQQARRAASHFLSASMWWRRGWLVLLELSSSP